MSKPEKLTAIIVEDEQASRETLASYLAKYCPGVELLALADSVKTGLETINKYAPDIVFLDVEMPYGNAFDLLEQVEDIRFETIFVTAFSNYAIKALNFSASYYILKPIDIDELVKSVEKVSEQRKINQYSLHSKILIENIQTINKQMHKIVLPAIDGFEVIKVQDIIRCGANDNFTDFFLINGQKKMISRTLKFYENLLCDFDFIRVHKSHLINMQYIKKYIKGKGGQVVMMDGSVVDISHAGKKELMGRF